MGCGTGILAILAKQLGATKLLGIDIDDWSIENSIENAAINHATDIDFKKGDASILPST
jgi:ribosomal protein L11 methyltransferase